MIDEAHYIILVGGYLDQFKKTSATTWNCRCPLCGDSRKDRRKARGHFYPAKDAPGYVFHCYNCGAHMWLGNFIKQISPALHAEMMIEKFGVGRGKSRMVEQTPAPEIIHDTPASNIAARIEAVAPLVTELPDTHFARAYLASRKIPISQWSLFRFALNYADIAELSDKYRGRVSKESRLVIPTYSQQTFNKRAEIVAVTGRSLNPDAKTRYLDITFDPNDPIIFGSERIDPNRRMYVVEGQFDSLFLPNAVAVGTSNLTRADRLNVPKDRIVLVPDLQPRNKEVKAETKKAIQKGFRIALLPNFLSGPTGKDKDINQFILAGYSASEIVDIIDRHTYSGLAAELELSKW